MTITPTEATPWAQPAEAVAASLGSSAEGLAASEAERRLAEGGRNELPAPATKPAWLRFLAHFNDLLVYILIAAAALKAFAGDWVDFAVIAVVIVATALTRLLPRRAREDAVGH